MLPFSGLMLHEAINHNSESLKFISMGLHNVAAIVFAISAVIHLKYDWNPLINYVKDKKNKLLNYPREMAIAGSTLIILLLLATFHVLHNHL
jgi:hypothetical protein